MAGDARSGVQDDPIQVTLFSGISASAVSPRETRNCKTKFVRGGFKIWLLLVIKAVALHVELGTCS